jgi:hypothetical protein
LWKIISLNREQWLYVSWFIAGNLSFHKQKGYTYIRNEMTFQIESRDHFQKLLLKMENYLKFHSLLLTAVNKVIQQ